MLFALFKILDVAMPSGNNNFFSTINVLLSGIVNITPDSFSDGGFCFNTKNAVKYCEKLLKDGQ